MWWDCYYDQACISYWVAEKEAQNINKSLKFLLKLIRKIIIIKNNVCCNSVKVSEDTIFHSCLVTILMINVTSEIEYLTKERLW